MLKTLLRPFLFMTLMSPSIVAWGAIERHEFDVSVIIPTAEFYVLPVDPQLVQREQRLPYSAGTSRLSPLRAFFDVKHASGSISARLGAEAYLSNGRDRIDLRVMFNKVQLGLEPVQVVPSAQAQLGQRVGLEIAAIEPADGYLPGDYYGTVHMVFDAVAP